MNQLVNSALLAYYLKTGEGKLKKTLSARAAPLRSYDTMSESERRELHQLLAGFGNTIRSLRGGRTQWNILRIRPESESDCESHV